MAKSHSLSHITKINKHPLSMKIEWLILPWEICLQTQAPWRHTDIPVLVHYVLISALCMYYRGLLCERADLAILCLELWEVVEYWHKRDL